MQVFNGWTTDSEPRSPITELFTRAVPAMVDMKRKRAFHFPPAPPHAELAPPSTTCDLPPFGVSGMAAEGWVRPELSDTNCDRRLLRETTPESIAALAAQVGHRLGNDLVRQAEPPLLIEDDHSFDTVMADLALATLDGVEIVRVNASHKTKGEIERGEEITCAMCTLGERS